MLQAPAIVIFLLYVQESDIGTRLSDPVGEQVPRVAGLRTLSSNCETGELCLCGSGGGNTWWCTGNKRCWRGRDKRRQGKGDDGGLHSEIRLYEVREKTVLMQAELVRSSSDMKQEVRDVQSCLSKGVDVRHSYTSSL